MGLESILFFDGKRAMERGILLRTRDVLCWAVLLMTATPVCVGAKTPAGAARQADDFDAIAKSAANYRDAGNAAAAIEAYKHAVALRPDWAEGWWNVGTLNYNTDRYAEGAEAFQKLVVLSPQVAVGWEFLGLCEFETKDFADSKAHLEKGLGLTEGQDAESSKVAHYHLALLLIRGGEFERASEMLGKEYGQGAVPSQVKTALGLALLRVPLLPREINPSKEAMVESAGEIEAQILAGNSKQALTMLQKLAAENSDVPYVRGAYGAALAGAGEKNAAEKEFAEAKKMSPEKALAEMRIAAAVETGGGVTAAGDFEQVARQAAAARNTNDFNGAIGLYKQGLALRPEWDEGRWNLAMLYYATARYSEAASELQQWVARNPQTGAAWGVLGLCEYAQGDYDNALIHLERGESIGFGSDANAVREARYRLGLLLIRKGEFEQARETLAAEAGGVTLAAEIQFALGLAILRMPMLPEQVDRSQAELVRSAGEIAGLLEQSKYDAAYPKLQDLLRRYPATPYLHYVYGTALASFSRYDEAEAQFREELKISPKSELPLMGLASVLLQARRAGEALPFARRAVEMAPGSANAHYLLGRALLETDGAEAAIPELVKAGELSPGSPEVHFALARAYAKADQTEKAEEERAIFVRLKSEAEERKKARSGPAVGGFQRQAGPATVENGGAARP